MAAERIGPRRGRLISMEGVWGAGKTTNARRLADHLAELGFTTTVLHHGLRDGFIGQLSTYQTNSRCADVTETAATTASTTRPSTFCCGCAGRRTTTRISTARRWPVTMSSCSIGLYTKLAYALTVLAEHHPTVPRESHWASWQAVTRPWLLEPDLAFHLDLPWQQARDRAVTRTRARGVPAPKSGSRERELFLPLYDGNLRWVAAQHPLTIKPITIGDRGPDDVFGELATYTARLLCIPALNGEGREQ
ncbi:MAG TPA: hypothetical protein VFW65_39720 [Pseudonocardiaceae bacterium]|nr:hypothetical protein [Pseudonocardiaceae bacterium]